MNRYVTKQTFQHVNWRIYVVGIWMFTGFFRFPIYLKILIKCWGGYMITTFKVLTTVYVTACRTELKVVKGSWFYNLFIELIRRHFLVHRKISTYTDAPWFVMGLHLNKPLMSWKYRKLKLYLIYLIYCTEYHILA